MAAGSALDSLDLDAAKMVSADSLSSSVATSATTPNYLTVLPEHSVAGERSAAKKLEIFLARDQVFTSFAPERNYVSAKRALWNTDESSGSAGTEPRRNVS